MPAAKTRPDAGDATPGAQPLPGFHPLYRQVKNHLVQRLIDGVWPPGLAIPSEGQLAQELGVSQGTVRKALDEMAAENLLVRRQGRGTFVAEHDEQRILFQFFKIVPDQGPPSFPDSRLLSAEEKPASAEEATELGLRAKARVIRIRRLRFIKDVPLIVEDISLPAALFPGLASGEIPNNLYAQFATGYGITVASARERLKAITLSETDAAALGVSAGTPALLIDRLALGLDGAAIEWRRSLCLTTSFHYVAELK
ncbi:MAG: GntR family transcriptional regulator [Bosea sp. (in: a-proteobacteria)]